MVQAPSLRRAETMISAVFGERAFPAVLSVSYAVSFFLFFFIPARFWDDLNITNNPDFIGMTKKSGILLGGPVGQVLLSLHDPDLAMRLCAFAGFFVAALLLRRFLAILNLVTVGERNAIVLLTAALPLYQSRFQVVLFYYSLAYLLFCGAAVLLAIGLLRRRPLYRIPAYILFVAAFYIESFLTLYFFLLLLLLLALPGRKDGPGAIRAFWIRSVDFVRRAPEAVALPFIFFILKTWLTPATGAFEGYNEVTARGVAGALLRLPATVFDALTSIPGDGPNWVILAAVAALALALLCLIRPSAVPPAEDDRPQRNTVALFVLLAGAALAVFPYIVVNHRVSPFDFDDRNQITLLLVAGGLAVFTVRTLLRRRLQWPMLFAILVWSVAHNASTYAAIIRDGHTQNAVIHAMVQNPAVQRHTSFLVDTRQWPNLSRHRLLSTAQLNCLMKQAYGDESRFAAEFTGAPFDWHAERVTLDRYKYVGTCFRDYRESMPFLLTVRMIRQPSYRNALTLTLLRLMAPERYEQALDGYFSVSLTPLPSGWLQSGGSPP